MHVCAARQVCLFLKTQNFFTLDISASIAAPVRQSLAAITNAVFGGTDGTDKIKLLPADDKHFEYFDITAHGFFILSLVFLCLIIALRSRIVFTIHILKTATKTIREAKCLPFFPFVTWACQLVTFFFFLTSGCFLYTAHIEPQKLQAAYEATKTGLDCKDSVSITECLKATVSTIQGSLVGSAAQDASGSSSFDGSFDAGGNVTLDLTPPDMVTFDDGDIKTYLYSYHLFAFLWVNQMFDAVSLLSMAAAVAAVYWTKNSQRCASFNGLGYALRYHFGTAIFGAFIVAVVQFIRIAFNYLKQQLQQAGGESNTALKYGLLAVNCLMACFERFVKYITRNAYIMCAINGDSFCTSAFNAFRLISKHGSRVVVVQ